jgi:hypothetical protein
MALVSHIESGLRQSLQSNLPVDFLSQLEIQRYACRTALALNNPNLSLIQSSLLDLIEHDLDAVKARLPEAPSLSVQLEFLSSKLRLYSFPLLLKHPSEPQRVSDTTIKHLWLKGFQVASQISCIFTHSIENEQSLRTKTISPEKYRELSIITMFYPKRYFRTLVMAGMFLLRIISLDDVLSLEDRTSAYKEIEDIQLALSRWSQTERDEMNRAARMIAFLLRHAQDHNSSAYFKEIASYPSLNMVDSGIRIAGKIRQGYRLRAPKEASTTTALSDAQELIPDLPLSGSSSSWFPSDNILDGWDKWLPDGDDVGDLFRDQSGLHFPDSQAE